MVKSLQALRFFAALGIVVFHAARHFKLSSENELINGIYYILANKFDIGVDVFFVISGYVIYSSYHTRNKGADEFIIDRIIRVAPMYWLTTIIFALILNINFSLYPISDISFASIVKSLLFIPSLNLEGKYIPVHSVGWSLNLEMMFYSVFAFCVCIFKKTLLPAVIATISLVYLLSSVIDGLSFYHSTLVFEFLAGCIIAALGEDTLSKIRRSKTLSSLILLISLLTIVSISSGDRILMYGLPAFLLVLFCVVHDKNINTTKAMMLLGASSYSLYLVHRIVIISVIWAFGYEPSALLLFIVSVVLSILLSILVYKYIEMPVTRGLRGFFKARLRIPEKI